MRKILLSLIAVSAMGLANAGAGSLLPDSTCTVDDIKAYDKTGKPLPTPCWSGHLKDQKSTESDIAHGSIINDNVFVSIPKLSGIPFGSKGHLMADIINVNGEPTLDCGNNKVFKFIFMGSELTINTGIEMINCKYDIDNQLFTGTYKITVPGLKIVNVGTFAFNLPSQ